MASQLQRLFVRPMKETFRSRVKTIMAFVFKGAVDLWNGGIANRAAIRAGGSPCVV